MTLSLVLAISGLVYLLLGLAKFEGANAEKHRLEAESSILEQEVNGTNLETAMKAVEAYKRDKGKPSATEKFDNAFIKNARFNALVAFAVKNKIESGVPVKEIEEFLQEQSTVGLSREIQREEMLTQLYEGLLNGSDRMEDLNNVLAKDEKVPVEIKKMAQSEGFNMVEGAKAKLSFHKGNNSNKQVQLDDLKSKETEAFAKTKSQLENMLSTLPELRKSFIEQSASVDEKYSENYTQQVQMWDRFLAETRRLIEKRRLDEIQIYKLSQELESKQGLLINRIEGRDWIPPLDLVDGQVLASDAESNVALIDIGRRDGLRKGQGFDVFRVKGDKIQETKGRIVVERVYSKISVCRIMNEADLNPIAFGDVVADGEQDNPFDRKLLKSYVLSGRFYKSYSKSLVETMI
jgi:hypothetical protein